MHVTVLGRWRRAERCLLKWVVWIQESIRCVSRVSGLVYSLHGQTHHFLCFPIRRLAVRVLQVWCVLYRVTHLATCWRVLQVWCVLYHVTHPATCCASLAGVVCVVPCHPSGDLLASLAGVVCTSLVPSTFIQHVYRFLGPRLGVYMYIYSPFPFL